MGHQVVASGLRVFLEHTLPVALQAWLAEHLSVMCRPAGRADHNPTNQPNEHPVQVNVLQEYVG